MRRPLFCGVRSAMPGPSVRRRLYGVLLTVALVAVGIGASLLGRELSGSPERGPIFRQLGLTSSAGR